MPLKHLNDDNLIRLPFCAVCKGSVHSISFSSHSLYGLVCFRVFCHGEVEEFTIPNERIKEGFDLSKHIVFVSKKKEERVKIKQVELIPIKINTLRRVRI